MNDFLLVKSAHPNLDVALQGLQESLRIMFKETKDAVLHPPTIVPVITQGTIAGNMSVVYNVVILVTSQKGFIGLPEEMAKKTTLSVAAKD